MSQPSKDIVIAKDTTVRKRIIGGRESNVGETVTLTVSSRVGGAPLTLAHFSQLIQEAIKLGGPSELVVDVKSAADMVTAASVTFSPVPLPQAAE